MSAPGRAVHGSDAPRSAGRDASHASTVDAAEIAAAETRRAAIARMLAMSGRHAEAVWKHRRSDQLSPHSIALLFCQPDIQPSAWYPWRVTAATKLWFAGDAARHLPDHLHRFWDAIANSPAEVDIRDWCNRRDDQMADDAEYFGLGVSTLDTYSGDCELALAGATRHEDIPGCVRIVLTDNTVITLERRGIGEYKQVNVCATASLDYAPGHAPYPWMRGTPEQLRGEAQHAQVLRFMTALNDTFWQLDRARQIARRSHALRRSA